MFTLVKPHAGPITQLYDNIQPDGMRHTGNDYGYSGPDGTVYPDVYAATLGTVLYAGDSRDLGWPNPYYLNPDFDRTDDVDSSAGNVVVLGHVGGHITIYAHLESWQVVRGQIVQPGQRIGITGATGRATGKHLHFELLLYPFDFGTATYGRSNPNPYLSGGIVPAGATFDPEEDDNMAGPIPAQQAEDIAQRAAALVLRDIVEHLDSKLRIHPIQAESIVQATVKRTKDLEDGATIDFGQAEDIAQRAAELIEEGGA
jgi:hypothetical protein